MLINLLDDMVSLVYPRTCAACNQVLLNHEILLCMFCEVEIPKTNYHLMPDNPIEKMFWGRFELESAAAYLHFRKQGGVQKIMHKLKYKGKSDVGTVIGERYGREVAKVDRFKNVDVIVPIPLHRDKQKTRGYNQSEMFGIGLSEGMNVPLSVDNFVKITATESQTKKNRSERWKNVRDVFQVNNPELLENKHILLIDDIITTGATIEAAALILLQIKGVKISVLGMAVSGG